MLMPFATLEQILHKIWFFDIKPSNHYFNINYMDPFYYIHTRVLNAKKERMFVMDEKTEALFEDWLKKQRIQFIVILL